MAQAVVIDTETTGFVPGRDRVIQIGTVVLSAGPVPDEAHSVYVDPGLKFVAAFQIHRITPAALAGAPSFAQVADWLHELIDGETVVGHNLSFDLRMLNGELELAGLPRLRPGDEVCTLRLAKKLIPGLPNRRLMTCCQRLRIPHSNAHDALGDATATAALYRRLVGSSREEPTVPVPPEHAQAWLQRLRTA